VHATIKEKNMEVPRNISLLLVIFLIIAGSLVYADEREEPVDVIIALDKSSSMVEEIDAVKEYVRTAIIDQLLIPGDFLTVVAFYGKTQIPISAYLKTNEEKDNLSAAISRIDADGLYTDIGNALDVLGSELEKQSDSDRKKYLLLITDGKQEAPPESKYYSPDGSFNHEFLANTRIIQMKGWKIHVLGIGSEQAARELAQELSGKYSEVSSEPTSEELAAKTEDFLGRVDLVEPPLISRLSAQGKGRITLKLASQGYAKQESVEMIISRILLSISSKEEKNILAGEYNFELKAEDAKELKIPIQVPDPPGKGEYQGTLEFFFASEEGFLPAVIPVSFEVRADCRIWLILAGGLILLALLTAAIIWAVVAGKKTKIRFRLEIEGENIIKKEEIYTAKEGKFLFIDQAEETITISAKRTTHSLAKLSVFKKLLRMSILKREYFPRLRDVPADVRDFAFKVRLENGSYLNAKLAAVEKS
jgi:Mg-chelatase subunit ChlD/uncharacterized protein YegP (UPF0339 family)